MTHPGKYTPVLLATALLLSACSSMPSFERNQPGAAAAVDDDTFCLKQGPAGSKEYVACRKDRDVQSTRTDRIERAHRNMAEDMLNAPSDKVQSWR